MTPLSKLSTRITTANTLLCVGLDADLARIPDEFRAQKHPQFAFNTWVIEHTHPYVCAYKPNIAFYEANGSVGLEDLQLTMDYVRERYPDIFLIIDAKRGDVVTTNALYAKALFNVLGTDAVTLSPYLGKESLKPFLERDDKVSIFLCKTSNPGAGEFQDLVLEGKPLWHHLAEHIRDDWNEKENCMLVVGATYPEDMSQIRSLMGEMTFLVPGIGAQGGEVAAAVRAGLNSAHQGMIINSARGIIFAKNPDQAAKNLRDEINTARLK